MYRPRLPGTGEPAYSVPGPVLRASAAEWSDRIDPAHLRELVDALPGPRNRMHCPQAMARTDAVLIDTWRASGWRVGRQRVNWRGVAGMNVVAISAGATTEAIVVVAHHDTIRDSPGADDNGAGVAALLVLATLLAGRRYRRTVILAAPDFEEVGLVGSRHLAHWLRGSYHVRGSIVFDPIGFMDPRPGSQAVPPGIGALFPGQLARLEERRRAGDTVVSVYRRSSLQLVRTWATCLSATIGNERVLLLRDPLDLPLIGPALLAVPAARHFSRSDHVNLWRAGMPAIHVTNTANFRNPNYHRPTDVPSTLDYDTLAAITAATALVIEQLAD